MASTDTTQSSVQVLLVDDEADFRQTVARRLAHRGIDVKQARDGAECLDILAQHPMDVVVTDVLMPGMNGIELLRRIKANYPEIEVILLTGQVTALDGVEGIKSGAFDYLRKPIELEHLRKKISQAHDKIKRLAEQKREAQFRARMEKQMAATERLAALGTLATGVAHEINNPLAIINEASGWLKLLLNKIDAADMPRRSDFLKALAKIETSIARIKRITHQMLGFARSDPPHFAEINARQLIDEALELVRPQARDAQIELLGPANAESLLIWSDPYAMRQVLINLLTNALHATGPGGTVLAELDWRDADVTICISDTGVGIPTENLEKIFEPFFTTKPPGQGTGLGLFLTRGIIKKLGGTITVDSQLGRGSRFILNLPRHACPADLIGDAVEPIHAAAHQLDNLNSGKDTP